MENTELFNDLEKVEIRITDHCLKRYAERVMDRPIIGLEAENKAKNEIKKLYLSSELYYTGVIGKSNNVVQVRCNKNGWTFIIDKEGKTIITLYKVDLMVDSDEVNQLYVDKALAKITNLKEVYEQSINSALEEEIKYNDELSKIDREINEYENTVKSLKARREAVKSLIATNKANNEAARIELRNVLEDFMVKDKFKLQDNDLNK